MIYKITSIPPNNSYKMNCSNALQTRPSFGHHIPTDLFSKEPVSLEKAINIICSGIQENVFIKLSDDADPLRSLTNMSLGIEKLATQNKLSVNFRYGSSDGGNGSIPVLISNSVHDIQQKMQKPEFIGELNAKIKKASLKELVPDDYHDSLD